MPAYSLRYLATLIDQFPQHIDFPITGVSVDSRTTKFGELFFALSGAKVEGHHFVSQAFSKGACAAVVKKNYQGPTHHKPLIFVEDVLKTLQDLAKNLLRERQTKIIAITGSLGKTTTKDFIASLLLPHYCLAFSPASYNSQIGVPLTILNHTNGNEEILVLEMGMSQRDELSRLVDIAPPTIALITTVALIHAGNFENLAEISHIKGEIFGHPKTQLGILDREIANFEEIAALGSCAKLSFALDHPQANYNLKTDCNRLVIKERGETVILDSFPLPGKHNLHNFLAAVAVVRHIGLTWEQISLALPALKLPERRLQFIEKKGILFVNDSYNAGPQSMKAALESLPLPKEGGKKIAILSEMLELGKFSEEMHREVGRLALNPIDYLFCYGKECLFMQEEWLAADKPIFWHAERAGILAAFKEIVKPGDVVLLKGSKAKEVWKVLDEI